MSTVASIPEEPQVRSSRRWWGVGILAAVVILVLAVIIVMVVPIFQVRSIEVTGNNATTSEDVIHVTGITEGDNLLRVNTTEAAAGVVTLPWVDVATVARSFPSTVLVDVTEHTPVAYVDTPQGPTLINERGVAFVIAEPPAGAVHIEGVDTENVDVVEGAVQISSALNDEHRELVRSIQAESEHSYVLHLHDGRRVVWGDAVNNDNKALAFDTVIEREGGEWNISNPSSVTVR